MSGIVTSFEIEASLPKLYFLTAPARAKTSVITEKVPGSEAAGTLIAFRMPWFGSLLSNN